MVGANSPRRLREVLESYYRAGSRGFLVSGGFNSAGFLPLTEDHLRVLGEFRGVGEVFLSVHLGLAPRPLVDKAMRVFDMVDFEVPPSQDYVRLGRGLAASVEQYLETLRYIATEYGEERVAAHVVVGSPLSSLDQELGTVRRIGGVYGRILVILIDANQHAVDRGRVLGVARLARELFGEVALGCMRPRTQGGLVEELVNSGYVDRVVLPGRVLVKRYGMRVVQSCCSIPADKLRLFLQSSA